VKFTTVYRQHSVADTAVRSIVDSVNRAKITTPPLHYDILDAEKQEIRLIRLLLTEPKLPGVFGNLVPIEIYMQHCPFDKCPPYTALSYAWNRGSYGEDNKYPILVNDHAIDVTESLWEALHEFQTRRLRSWLWIDAICINQKNDSEKSEQVQRMRSIYSKASRVI
jgi:hypothetical protein